MCPPPHISGSPQIEGGPHGEICPHWETFPSEGAPLKAPSTEPLLMIHPHSPLHPALKVPGRRDLLQVPHMGSLWKEMPVSRAFSVYPSGSPAREPSLQTPFTELPQRETLHLQSPFQPYLKVPGRWSHSRLPNWAPMKRDAHPQSLPFITFSAPRKGAPPPGSPNRTPIERCPISRAPFQLSQSSRWTDPRWYLTGPLWRKVPVSRAFTRSR